MRTALLVLLLVASLAHADTRTDTATGAVWSMAPGGWKPTPPAKVTLSSRSGTATLTVDVEADGKPLARLDRGVLGAGVELRLVPVGDANLVSVVSHRADGAVELQIFAVANAGLREIYRAEPRLVRDVSAHAAQGETGGVPNLVLVTLSAGPTRAEALAWNGKAYALCPSCKATLAPSTQPTPPTPPPPPPPR